MNKLIYVWFAVKTLFCTCQTDHKINDFRKVGSHYKINKIGKLPSVVSESSGLARSTRENIFWTHNDSGGKAELYGFDLNGKLIEVKPVPNAKNGDWEDLAADNNGNIFVGDFGNNAANRSSFDIYKFNPSQSGSEKITFKYKDQQSAHEPKKSRFDCEAFFYHDNNLYLFSKPWEKQESVKLYKLPARQGDHSLSPVDSIYINSQVTAADISPDGKTFALLTYGKVLLFEISKEGIDFKKPLGCFRLVRKQNEALIFLNNTDMLVTNEQGDIYKITYR